MSDICSDCQKPFLYMYWTLTNGSDVCTNCVKHYSTSQQRKDIADDSFASLVGPHELAKRWIK